MAALENAATAIGLGQIYYGSSLNTLFNRPGVPDHPGPCCQLREGGDPRTPDIVVIPNVGVVYTGGDKKQSEHGGYAWDDTNVMLLVSNPSFQARTIHSFVETAQVAPTILQLLGLDPNALDAVRMEGTPVLPSLFAGGNTCQAQWSRRTTDNGSIEWNDSKKGVPSRSALSISAIPWQATDVTVTYFVKRTLSRMALKVLSYFSYADCGATQTKETNPSGRSVVTIQSVSCPPTGESLLRYVARPGWPFRRTRSGWRVIFMLGFDF